MTNYNLGRVVPKWRGGYDPNTTYDELDIVAYYGSSFVCLNNGTKGITPSEDGEAWGLVARRGSETEVSEEQINAIKQACLQYLYNAGAIFDNDYTHTDNNFTDDYKAKLNGIEAGAKVNVQSDWNEDSSTSDAFIKNKPSFTPTDNNFTDALKDKLEGIQNNAQVNVQPDWNQTNSSADDYIKNKPSLAAVATTGSYNSLRNKPELFSGDYTDLTNKPTIPTRFSELTNDQVFIEPPTVIDLGEQTNVSITTLSGNTIYQCNNLQSLTISAYGSDNYLPTYIFFQSTPDVSLNLSIPENTYWVTEAPLFYAETYAQHYLLKIQNNVAQLFFLTTTGTNYPNYTEEAARWSAATWAHDPEDWEDFTDIEPAYTPLF